MGEGRVRSGSSCWGVYRAMFAQRSLREWHTKSGKYLGKFTVHLIQPGRIFVGKPGCRDVPHTHLCYGISRGTGAKGEEWVVQECLVSGRKVIFLLVHLFLQYDLFGNFEGLPCTVLVDLGCCEGRLNTSFEAPVASPGGSYVSSFLVFRGRSLTLLSMSDVVFVQNSQ